MENKETNAIFKLYNKLKKDKKTFFIMLIGLSGILLILFSELISSEEAENTDSISAADYSSVALKDELEQTIGKIKGVGRTKVMITYDGTPESVYASDSSEHTRGDELKRDGKHIIIDKGNTEDGLLLKEIYPRVTGVAVVCEGGGNPTVKNEITLMLKALFNISSNSISISEMNS